MMLRYDPVRPTPRADCLSVFERNFMRIDLKNAALGKGNVRRPMYVEKWSDHYHDAAAQLIAEAYAGHIDSRINDQYRSERGGAAVSAQHRAVSGLRSLLPSGFARRIRGRERQVVRHLAGQPGDAGDGPRDADLRESGGSRYGNRV